MFPMYQSASGRSGFKDYCWVKMMLHHPFFELSELQMPNKVGEQTYTAAYHLCQLKHYSQHNMNSLNIKAEEEAEPEEDFTPTQYEPELKEECGPQDPFVELAARCESGRGAVSSQDNASDHSNQLDNLAYNWQSSDYLFKQFSEQLNSLTLTKLMPECIKCTQNGLNTLIEAQ